VIIDQLALTHLLAMLIGVVIGVAIALPWRPLIRRHVATKNIAELTKQLHAAIADLEAIEQRERNDPFIGNMGAFA